MPQKAEYRSAIRSKKMIRHAFIELLGSTAADKITVTDLAQKAGLNRGTFYAHYEDNRPVFCQQPNERGK